MICPNCKNEKLQEAVCSHCGLGEKEALLKAVDRYRVQDNLNLVLQTYDRYLTLEPGDLEIARKNAILLCSMALDQKDPALFKKADQKFAKILETDWDWRVGHENRLNLYLTFGNTASLAKEYKEMEEKDPARADLCDWMIKTIQLAKRFKEEKPTVPTNLESIDIRTVLIGNLWFLGFIFLLMLIVKLSLVPTAYNNALSWPTVCLFSLLCYGAWIVFKNWRLQRPQQKPKTPILPPTLEP